jgi:hypothetical protein
MRALFGVVSLLVVVAVIGLLLSRQLKTVGGGVANAIPPVIGKGASAPTTLREQSRQLQERVKSDVGKALEQGVRHDDAEQ